MEKLSVEKEMKNLLYNLVWLKNRYKLSKEKMAEILGISINTWNKIEDGKLPSELTAEIFLNIKNYFNVSPSALITEMFGE